MRRSEQITVHDKTQAAAKAAAKPGLGNDGQTLSLLFDTKQFKGQHIKRTKVFNCTATNGR